MLSSRMLFRGTGLAAFAVAATLVTSSQGTAAAATPTTASPAQGAAGWLSQQFSDHYVYPGGKYFDGGSTADSIYALAAAGVGKHQIDAAIRYFAKHVNDYTQVKDTSGKPGPSDGAIGKTVVAALVAGANPTHFGGYNLLRALKKDQCTSHSEPVDGNDFTTPVCPAAGAARNTYSSISESFAILAEARGAKSHGSSYAPNAAAMSYFLSLQCANGGFTANTSGGGKCTSDPDATAYAMMALQSVANRPAALAHAAHWLSSVRNADGSWTAQNVHNVDSTGLSAAALKAHGANTSRSMSWLVGQQVTTGPTVGAGATRGALKYQGKFDAASSIKATADGLLGMVDRGSLANLSDASASAGTPLLALPAPTVRHQSVRAGTAQTVTGTGFSSGETVHGVLHSAPVRIGGAKADKNGTVTLRFTVARSLSGTHVVRLTGQRSGLISTVSFRVTAVATATSAPSSSAPVLAVTGQDSRQTGVEIALGAALVAGGGGLLVLGRRRPRHR